jgi:hypothetical protein
MDFDALQHLDDLLSGRRKPANLQDTVDLRRAEFARAEPMFTRGFWLRRAADLMAAGFSKAEGDEIIAEVRKRVEAVNLAEEHVRAA